jgi:hypothetical protein
VIISETRSWRMVISLFLSRICNVKVSWSTFNLLIQFD